MFLVGSNTIFLYIITLPNLKPSKEIRYIDLLTDLDIPHIDEPPHIFRYGSSGGPK